MGIKLSFTGLKALARVVCNFGLAWERVEARPSLVEGRSGGKARPLVGDEGGLRSDLGEKLLS